MIYASFSRDAEQSQNCGKLLRIGWVARTIQCFVDKKVVIAFVIVTACNRCKFYQPPNSLWIWRRCWLTHWPAVPGHAPYMSQTSCFRHTPLNGYSYCQLSMSHMNQGEHWAGPQNWIYSRQNAQTSYISHYIFKLKCVDITTVIALADRNEQTRIEASRWVGNYIWFIVVSWCICLTLIVPNL